MTTAKTTDRRAEHPAAFSYVEIIVVIGILALLLALVLPVVGRARAQARTAVCASQLHQVYMAAQSWRQDNSENGGIIPIIPAVGWRTEFRPYLQTMDIYLCPADGIIGGTDAAAGAKPVTPAASPSGVSETPTPPPAPTPVTPPEPPTKVHGAAGTADWDLDGLYVLVHPKNGVAFQIPVKPGPLCHSLSDTAVLYPTVHLATCVGGGLLGFEDAQNAADFTDLTLSLADTGQGYVALSVMSKHSDCTFDLRWPAYFERQPSVIGIDLGGTGRYRVGTTWLFPGWIPWLDVYQPPPAAPVTTTPAVTSTASGTPAPPTTGTPGFSTDSSYGLNGSVDGVYGDVEKIFALDYTTSVADIVDNWLAEPYTLKGSLLFARHGGRVNVLYGDGSVRLCDNPQRALDPAIGQNALKMWKP